MTGNMAAAAKVYTAVKKKPISPFNFFAALFPT